MDYQPFCRSWTESKEHYVPANAYFSMFGLAAGGHDLVPGVIVSPIAAALRHKDLVLTHPRSLLASGTAAGTANKSCKKAKKCKRVGHDTRIRGDREGMP